jgi:nucleoprotein TPR
MAVAVPDIEYLSAYLSIPQPTLFSLIDTPTTELIRSVLQAITAKAHEHDEILSEKLRVDIELENAVRSSETRIQGLRSTIEKSQNTVEEVRTKLKEEGKALKYAILSYHLLTFFSQKTPVQFSKVNSRH